MPRKLRLQHPDLLVFVTNRCLEARYFSSPDEEGLINAAFALSLREAQLLHQIEAFAYVLMGNHFHGLFRGNLLNMPAFMRDLQSRFARRLNRIRGRRGTVFPDRYHDQFVKNGDSAELTQAMYCLLNPVRAKLVTHPSLWPGLISLATYSQDHCAPVDEHTVLDEHGVALSKLPFFDSWRDQWDSLGAQVASSCNDLIQELGVSAFKGRKAVFATHWDDKPNNPKHSPPQTVADSVCCHDTVAKAAILADIRATIDLFRRRVDAFVADVTARCHHPLTGLPPGSHPPVLMRAVAWNYG